MTTVYHLRALRIKLVQDRADCVRIGWPTDATDLAIANIDRQLQEVLGDEDEDGSIEGARWGDLLLCIGGVALIAVAVWWCLG